MAKLSFIKEKLQNILSELSFTKEISTDKGLLQYEGEELAEGIRVQIVDEEGNAQSVEDGEYYLGEEDGRTLVIEDSTIKEIKEKELKPDEADPENEEFKAEEQQEEEGAEEEGNNEEDGEDNGNSEDENGEETETEPQVNASKQRFDKVKELYEESYQEKEQKIISAIRQKGFDCWLIEAGDDYAVVEVWNDATADYLHYKFPVTWDENGEASVGDPQEVKSEYVPVNEEVFSKQEKEGLEQEIVQLKAKIQELEGKPASEPAKVAFRNQIKSDDKDKLGNLMRYVK